MENSLLADDIILYVENPKESTKLSEFTTAFSKVVDYINKINTQNQLYFYTINSPESLCCAPEINLML